VLKLQPGKNALLLKICQGNGDWAFYFAAKPVGPAPVTWKFEDASVQAGLGANGIGSTVKGDTLTVCDVNGDGRPDFLYGAGTGLLVLNTPKGFVEAKGSGIIYKSGKVGPVFGDFLGDGHPGLFVPQLDGRCKLFRNDGQGHFTDVTAQAGDLGLPVGQAVCAAWGDFHNSGRLDLLVGCLHGPNRLFHNLGGGKFKDATAEVGLNQRIYNTQAVCLVDLNNDGMLDMVFNNEGQEPAILLGNPAIAAKRTPVSLHVAGTAGVIGSRVRLLDAQGKVLASHDISGGDGRGGQRAPIARFALAPGKYRVTVRYSSGLVRAKAITVDASPLREVIDDQTPLAE
jgi:FG-GAP-like repeat/FG-GAP repeat